MGKIIDLSKKIEMKNKIEVITEENVYTDELYKEIDTLNGADFAYMTNVEQTKVLYKLAKRYRKLGKNEEAITILNHALEASELELDKDYYYRCEWLKINCQVSLGIDKKENVVSIFEVAKCYYESINNKSMAYLVAVSVGEYNKDVDYMYYYFKKIIKNKENTIDFEQTIISVLDAILEVGGNQIYTKAKTYLCKNHSELGICMVM